MASQFGGDIPILVFDDLLFRVTQRDQIFLAASSASVAIPLLKNWEWSQTLSHGCLVT